jgi:hypothetical protein
MPAAVDMLLVLATVAAAIGYFLIRKLRSVKKVQRDWASGHAESCGNCAVVEIRRRQLAAKK